MFIISKDILEKGKVKCEGVILPLSSQGVQWRKVLPPRLPRGWEGEKDPGPVRATKEKKYFILDFTGATPSRPADRGGRAPALPCWTPHPWPCKELHMHIQCRLYQLASPKHYHDIL